MTDAPPAGIIETLRKIRRLANGATNEHEAAAAAAKLQALMTAHGIAELEAEAADPAAATARYFRFDLDPGNGAGWRAHLAHGIARAAGTRACTIGGTGTVAIIGRRDSIQYVRDTFAWLAAEIDRLAVGATRAEFGPSAPGQPNLFGGQGTSANPYRRRESRRTWANGWRNGAAATVIRRLQEQADADRAATRASTTALIVADQAAISAKFREQFPHTRGLRRSVGGSAGYMAGRTAGHGIGLGGRRLGAPVAGYLGA